MTSIGLWEAPVVTSRGSAAQPQALGKPSTEPSFFWQNSETSLPWRMLFFWKQFLAPFLPTYFFVATEQLKTAVVVSGCKSWL